MSVLATLHRTRGGGASSAFVNGALVAKFAWSEVRAMILHREGVLLQRLAALAPDLPLPELVALHDDPVLVVTRLLDGEPLSWGGGSDLRGHRLAGVAEVLAGFLAGLHRLRVDDVLAGLPQVTVPSTPTRATEPNEVSQHTSLSSPAAEAPKLSTPRTRRCRRARRRRGRRGGCPRRP